MIKLGDRLVVRAKRGSSHLTLTFGRLSLDEFFCNALEQRIDELVRETLGCCAGRAFSMVVPAPFGQRSRVAAVLTSFGRAGMNAQTWSVVCEKARWTCRLPAEGAHVKGPATCGRLRKQCLELRMLP